MMQALAAACRKPLQDMGLRPNPEAVKVPLMNPRDSLPVVGCLDITPKWGVIQTCLIT
jgi:hypothetical protein